MVYDSIYQQRSLGVMLCDFCLVSWDPPSRPRLEEVQAVTPAEPACRSCSSRLRWGRLQTPVIGVFPVDIAERRVLLKGPLQIPDLQFADSYLQLTAVNRLGTAGLQRVDQSIMAGAGCPSSSQTAWTELCSAPGSSDSPAPIQREFLLYLPHSSLSALEDIRCCPWVNEHPQNKEREFFKNEHCHSLPHLSLPWLQ